ncbi:protein LURP-one-related 15 isoform X2 [Physcomitrium patens]
MAYHHGIGDGGYPHSPHTPTPVADSTSWTGYGFVPPPQHIHQIPGSTPGATIGVQHVPVVGQQYVSNTVQSYVISKKKLSVSQGDWTITDQAGNSAFKVDGRIASMHSRRFLRDAAGNTILSMKKKVLSVHDTWEILTGNGDQVVATCRNSSVLQLKTSVDVMLVGKQTSTSTTTPDYQVKGDVLDWNLTVFRGRERAAVVSRQVTAKTVVLDRDSFDVAIFPGVDQVLVLALLALL